MMRAVVAATVLVLAVSATRAVDYQVPVDDPVAFVRSIELAEPKYNIADVQLGNKTRTKLDTPPDNKKEGYIVGGGITAFTDSVEGIHKQDILDATLFAQLAADKMYDREHDTVNWYSYYKYVLGNIGFAIQSFGFQQYKATGNTLSMDKVVLEILAAVATGGQSEVILATINALRGADDNSRSITLFAQQSSTSESGNFQVYPCEQSRSGDISLALGAFYFKAKSHHGRFLFFSWGSSNVSIYKGAQKIVLNKAVYAKVRDGVSKKLGDNAVNLVASIEL